MTEEEIIARQKKMFQDILEKDIPLQRAVRDTLQQQVSRIFVRGEKSDGSPIGKYNTTKPLYVNPEFAPTSFPTKGKTGEDTFKSGKKHKAGYFPHYKAFREAVNRPTDKVNLDLTSDLRFDISNSVTEKVNPVQVNTHEYVVGFKRPHNVKKAQGHEDKYGKIYHNTDTEVKKFFEVAAKEFKLITSAR